MQDDVEPQPPAAGSFLTLFPSIMLPMFLAVVDQTIVATALPAIAASLGNIDRVSLVVVSYLVATTVAAPLYGQLRDMHGGRRMMLIALSVFLAASLLCALATSIEMLIFARVLQGLGGGGLMTLTQSLIGESVPPRERARYQGYLAAVMVTSSVFGPVVGGYLAHSFGWRSIFLINLPLGALAMLLTLRLPARPHARAALGVRRPRRGAVRPLHPADAGGALSGPGAAPRSPAGADRAGGGRRDRAGPAGAARAASGVSAVPAGAAAPAHHLAQRCPGGLPRRGAGVAGHLPAALPAHRPGHVACRVGPAAAAADVRHRHRLDGDRPHGQPHGLHHHLSRPSA